MLQLGQETGKRDSGKFKVVLLGDQMVGKTSIIESYLGRDINQHYVSTIGVDFFSKNTYNSETKQNIRMQIWDCAGQQRFRALIPSYLRDTQAVIFVLDITSKKSFVNMRGWLKYLQSIAVTILIGNKKDLQSKRQVSQQQARAFANQNNMEYIEVSAKTSYNIQQCFKMLLNTKGNRNSNKKQQIPAVKDQIDQENKQKKELKKQEKKQQSDEYHDIEEIGLSTKAVSILKQNQIKTIQILLLASESDLAGIGVPLGDRIRIRSLKKP